MIAVQNVSGQPQVVDSDGHVLGAGEFRAVEPDERTNSLLEQGALAQVEQPAGKQKDLDLDPDAAAALKAATTSGQEA